MLTSQPKISQTISLNSAVFPWQPPDATLEGSSMGYLSLPYSQGSAVFPGVARVSDLKESHGSHAAGSRQKRNILFPSGVRLCAQETVQQVVANHLSYFHLRGKTITFTYRAFIRRFCPKWLSVIHTDIHTLIAVAAMQGAVQHIRSSWGSVILPKDTRTRIKPASFW